MFNCIILLFNSELMISTLASVLKRTLMFKISLKIMFHYQTHVSDMSTVWLYISKFTKNVNKHIWLVFLDVSANLPVSNISESILIFWIYENEILTGFSVTNSLMSVENFFPVFFLVITFFHKFEYFFLFFSSVFLKCVSIICSG